MSVKIAAVYASPRRNGNTATLLSMAVKGAEKAGASVDSIVLRDYDMSPCLEIYGCKQDGECAIKDDFQPIRDRLLAADGIMIATPVFFYTVSAHLKIFMDRCQSLWVKKYWIDKASFEKQPLVRKGFVIAAGATRGKKLFDGMLLSLKYFFEVLDTDIEETLLCRGLDFEDDVLGFPETMADAYERGMRFARSCMPPRRDVPLFTKPSGV